jgi:hypothetical protein
MELAEVSTVDGMLGSTNDTKALWEDEDGQITTNSPSLFLDTQDRQASSSRASKLSRSIIG